MVGCPGSSCLDSLPGMLLLFVFAPLCLRQNQHKPPMSASTTTGITTPTAIFAPDDIPDEPPTATVPGVPEPLAELVVTVVVLDPVVGDKLEVELVVSRSLLWYTMRTPNAFSPPALVKPSSTALVIPLFTVTTGSDVPGMPGAIHVQNSVDHAPCRVLVVTHDKVTSLSKVGQQVMVVIDATPVWSWQALTYPDGHMRPGEK